MGKIYTAQFRYSGEDRLDITVKTGSKIFAPSWDIVMGVKNGKISEEQYTIQYLNILRSSYNRNHTEWEKVLAMDKVTAVCYCGYIDKKTNEKVFCHRHIFANVLRKMGMEYMGEREL